MDIGYRFGFHQQRWFRTEPGLDPRIPAPENPLSAAHLHASIAAPDRSGPLSCKYRRRNSAAGLCRSSSRAAGDANRPHGRPLVPDAQPAGAHSASRHFAPEGRAPRSGRSGGVRCGAEEAGTVRWKPVGAGAGGPFKAVTRYEPTGSGPKRPFRGRKRGGPCQAPCLVATGRARHGA